MQRGVYGIVLSQLLLWGTSVTAMGQAVAESPKPSGYRMEAEVEYLLPIREHRQIDTVSMNLLFRKKPASDSNVSIYYGGTLTRAWGHNTYHADGQTLEEYDNSVYGIGPTALWRYTPFEGERIAFSIDGSAGLIFYTDDFPAGGDFYNFMWRFGPKLSYRVNDQIWLSVGYKWMHVSNGQHGHNPAYDARGISLSAMFKF